MRVFTRPELRLTYLNLGCTDLALYPYSLTDLLLLIKYIAVSKIIKYTGGILSRRILLDVMVMK